MNLDEIKFGKLERYPTDVEILAMDIRALAESILQLYRENDLPYSHLDKMEEIIKKYSLIGVNHE